MANYNYGRDSVIITVIFKTTTLKTNYTYFSASQLSRGKLSAAKTRRFKLTRRFRGCNCDQRNRENLQNRLNDNKLRAVLPS